MDRSVIVFVDDERPIIHTLRRFVAERFPDELKAQAFDDPKDMLDWLEETSEKVAAVVADHRMDEMRGTELLQIVKERIPGALRILNSAYCGDPEVTDAIQNRWIHHVVEKPDRDQEELEGILRHWLASPNSKRSNDAFTDDEVRALLDSQCYYVGNAMLATARLTLRFAEQKGHMLIRGESGAGKEVLAKIIHENSPRKGHTFEAKNCAVDCPGMTADELFGHEEGSFTDAKKVHQGLFERNHLGTLFLDEIDKMPIDVQKAVLRAVEGHPFTRQGGEEAISVDVRIVSATSANLEKAIRDGEFLLEFFHRLSVLDIAVPPLRQRRGEVFDHATYLIKKRNAKNPDRRVWLGEHGREKLEEYDWPGNVRQLKNAINHACAAMESNPATTMVITAARIVEIAQGMKDHRSDRGCNGSTQRTESTAPGVAPAPEYTGVVAGGSESVGDGVIPTPEEYVDGIVVGHVKKATSMTELKRRHGESWVLEAYRLAIVQTGKRHHLDEKGMSRFFCCNQKAGRQWVSNHYPANSFDIDDFLDRGPHWP